MNNTPRQRLLLISHHNSYRIAPYIKAAIKLGLEVTKPHGDIGRLILKSKKVRQQQRCGNGNDDP